MKFRNDQHRSTFLREANKQSLKNYKLIEDLVAIIKSFNEEVRVVLEDTGHYHLPVVASLVENGIFICCVNALRMKKFLKFLFC